MSMTEPTTTPEGAAASLAQLRDRIARTVAGFSRGQRITLGVAALAVVGLVLAVGYVQGHGPMAALYTGLGPEDVGVITKELQSKGIPYELTDGGGTVNVPQDQVYQLRADLAEVQLPGSGKVGYGILDDQSITASDFSQQVGYQRAMEGEMARTIEAMSGIDAATVHLAIPKDQVFALDDEQPSASVMVKTSRTLDAEQVQAISNIVASGIQGLSPDRVSVADSEGHLLASPGGGGSSAGNARQQDALDAYESSVGDAIESMLAASFGPGKAKVTVSADLDFDQRSTTQETFESPTTLPGATSPVASEESTKRESYGAGAPADAGILGTNGTEAPAAGADGSYTLDQRDVKYALNHAVETTNSAPGKVNRISVAVIVDEAAVGEDQVAQVQELVSAAAGVQVDRGDTVVVNRMPFDTTLQKQMQKQLEARAKEVGGSSSDLMLYAAAGLLALLVIGATFTVLRRRKKDLRRLEELAAQLSNRAAEPDADLTAVNPIVLNGTDGASVDGRFGTTAPPLVGVNHDGGREERQQVLTELIDNQPDEVAQLLRGWLGDRRAVRR